MLKNSKPVDEDKDKNAPQILPDGMWLWRCFLMLNSQRHAGQSGPQPITLADIAALVALEDFERADAVWMTEVMLRLDQVWLEEVYKQIKKREDDEKRKANKKNNTRRGTR